MARQLAHHVDIDPAIEQLGDERSAQVVGCKLGHISIAAHFIENRR